MTLNLNNEVYNISSFSFTATIDENDDIIYRIDCSFVQLSEVENIESFSEELITNIGNSLQISTEDDLSYTFENYLFDSINLYAEDGKEDDNTLSISFYKNAA